MGIHLRAFSESYPMNINMTRFQWFSKIFALCILVLWMIVASALEGLTQYSSAQMAHVCQQAHMHEHRRIHTGASGDKSPLSSKTGRLAPVKIRQLISACSLYHSSFRQAVRGHRAPDRFPKKNWDGWI